jgi:uncharacterized protein HemY
LQQSDENWCIKVFDIYTSGTITVCYTIIVIIIINVIIIIIIIIITIIIIIIIENMVHEMTKIAKSNQSPNSSRNYKSDKQMA